MAKRKTKRNAGRLQGRHGFKIRQDPMVHLAEDGPLPDARDGLGLTRVHGSPFLFAIARDARTIFASWNIDWRSVFENAMPADRKVHLRVIGEDGVIETTVAVEPMSAMHYLTISGLHDSYCVEIGYYQPADVWYSVATTHEIVMPPSVLHETVDVDVATIPFHIGFQQLLNIFGSDSKMPLAVAISRFEKRVLSSEQSRRPTAADKAVLRALAMSLPHTAAAWRRFDETDTQKLMKLTGAQLPLGVTSPFREFGQSSWS